MDPPSPLDITMGDGQIPGPNETNHRSLSGPAVTPTLTHLQSKQRMLGRWSRKPSREAPLASRLGLRDHRPLSKTDCFFRATCGAMAPIRDLSTPASDLL